MSVLVQRYGSRLVCQTSIFSVTSSAEGLQKINCSVQLNALIRGVPAFGSFPHLSLRTELSVSGEPFYGFSGLFNSKTYRPSSAVKSSESALMATKTETAAKEPCPEGYRPNVGVCLVNKDNLVFVANRIDLDDSWQMPQGGIDEGETPAEAAVRELREETGVTSANIIGQISEWVTYDFPPDVRVRLRDLWGKDWKGQAQKWFLFRLTGDESEINLLGDGSEKPEFSEYKWVEAEWVVSKAVIFKRASYEKVMEEFSKVLTGGLASGHPERAGDGKEVLR